MTKVAEAADPNSETVVERLKQNAKPLIPPKV
jgi:hypothetical protein